VDWTFGDGGTASGTTTSHTYTATGTYTVCETSVTICGTDTACDTVNILCAGAPIASFTDSGTHTVSFTYTGTTTGLDSVVWNFGDGHTDTGLNPHHIYATTDTYHVCVTVYTYCGKDSACSNIIVHTVGVPSVAIANIQVYPNPAGDELNVTGVLQNTNYRLLTVTGVAVSSGVLHSGNNVIGTKNIIPGVYVFELTDLDGNRNMVRVVKE